MLFAITTAYCEEEPGIYYSLTDTCDIVYNGVHLVLVYDAESNSFLGTAKNNTRETLKKVRVEVHLSNGIELGPTIPADLNKQMTIEIKLPAGTSDFVSWAAHPEVGSNEHRHENSEKGHEREDGEHGKRNREHG